MEIALPPWTTFTVSTSTNLGPLTTAISFPDDCLSKIWDFQTPGLQPPAEQSLWTYYTQGCAVASCCPNSKPYSEAYEWLTTYYSPAVCPHSYKACLGPTGFTPELAQGESTAFCCPANYNCPASLTPWWACQSILDATTLAYEIDTFPSQQTVATSTVTWDNHYIVAYPIQIRWKDSDQAIFASATASGVVTVTEGSGGVKTSSASGANATASESAGKGGPGGLSSGAKAGIGVGVSLGIIFILALLGAFFFMRRRKPQTTETAYPRVQFHELDQNQMGPVEMGVREPPRWELPENRDR